MEGWEAELAASLSEAGTDGGMTLLLARGSSVDTKSSEHCDFFVYFCEGHSLQYNGQQKRIGLQREYPPCLDPLIDDEDDVIGCVRPLLPSLMPERPNYVH